MKIGKAGKQGDKICSDCFVEIKLISKGGIKLTLKSKVNALYGESIKSLIETMCSFFEIKNAVINVEDYGALEYTIAARFESAYKQIMPQDNREFLLPFKKHSLTKTTKERVRRSRLYLPGNEPKYFTNAGIYKPDAIILDLEDSVAPSEKDSARYLVRNALRTVNFYASERMVRINQLPMGLDDLEFIVPNNVNVILIPKCESAETIIEIVNKIIEIKKKRSITTDIFLIPILESALGIIKAYKIATASENVCALSIGLEDYTADIGAERTKSGEESFFARSMVINAAKAAGIQALDSVFSNVDDSKGLIQSVHEAKSLGFEGKGCIHPRQVKIIHNVFAPSKEEIDKAKKIVLAFEEAEAKGIGVVSLGSKMIDAPVVKRALRTIKLAVENKLIEKNWRKEEKQMV